MSCTIEIEAKFRVEQQAIFADILRTTILGRFTLVPTSGIEYQHNICFDTPDLRLAARHSSLRVRTIGQRRFGAFKHSLRTDTGIHTRQEWEVELDGDDNPYDWPNSPAREQALAALRGATEVLPLVQVTTWRQYIYAIRARIVIAEICLDEGTIVAGDREVLFRELEVELVEGQPYAEFKELLEQLYTHYPLVPEPHGTVPIGSGWLSVDATTRGNTFRLITTHLSAITLTSGVQAQQAQELLAGPAATSLPVIIAGDFNSTPTGAAYSEAVGAGFADEWTAANGGDTGYTAFQVLPTINNPRSNLSVRIDYVLARGPIAAQDAYLIGATPSARTASGLWPSDHAGLVAQLEAGP